jgi:PST family polysaccharide transporter
MIASLASAVFSILRSKVTAVALGPAGIGITAEIQQLVTLANVPTSMMLGPALVSGVAEARARGDFDKVSRLYASAWTGVLVVSGVAGVLAVVAGYFFLPDPWGRRLWPLTILAAVGALLSSLRMIPPQMLMASGRLRRMTVIALFAGGIETALICSAIAWYGLTGQFVAFALAPLLLLPLTLALARSDLHEFSWRPRWGFSRDFGITAAKVGAASLVAALAMQSLLTVARWTLEKHGGPDLNGQFQAAWAIGTTYFSLALGGLGSYFFPRYAAARDPSELATEVESGAQFVLRIAPPAVLLLIGARDLVVHALYSHRFDPAIELVGVLLVGDVAKGIAWVQSGPLLYRGKIGAFLGLELFGSLTTIVGTIVLVPRFSLLGVGYASVLATFAYCFLSALVLHRSCGVRPSAKRLALIAACTLLAGGALYATRLGLPGRLLVLGAALALAYRSGLIRSMTEGAVARFRRLRDRR